MHVLNMLGHSSSCLLVHLRMPCFPSVIGELKVACGVMLLIVALFTALGFALVVFSHPSTFFPSSKVANKKTGVHVWDT